MGIQCYQNQIMNKKRGILFWAVILVICLQFVLVAILSVKSTLSNVMYLVDGTFIILTLIVALRSFKKLIRQYPEIKESNYVMTVHLWLFIIELASISVETIG